MIPLLRRRTLTLLVTVGLLFVNSPPLRGDMVDLQLEYDASTLEWGLYAQVVPTGSGSSGVHGLAAVRALIDNVPLAGVSIAGDIGAIDPIDFGGNNQRSAVVGTLGGTVDLIYVQNLAAPATVVEGVGVGSRRLIASGNYLSAAIPPSFGDDDFGYGSDGNFLNRLGPSAYGPALPWDAVSLSVIDVSPQGIEGDYNNDGTVDARDYTLWRNHLGAPAGSLENDPHNTAIGAAQYSTWKSNYGLSLPPGGLHFQAVPEPRAVVLFAGILLLAVGCRGSRALLHARWITRSAWTGGPIIFSLLVVLLIPVPSSARETSYSVGVAKVDVTPSYPVRLNGFGFRRDESEGVGQRIWAKAMAISSGDGPPHVIITLDNLGVRETMVDEVVGRLKEKTGIERKQVALTFTHTHTAPKVNGACDTIFSTPIPPEHQAHIEQYTSELTDELEEVVLAAIADQKPARLEWAVGKVGFAVNRRTKGGPVDHRLPMLVVRAPEGDEIRAIYVTYACHCVSMTNNKIGGDWAGFAQEAIERNHPGAIGMVSIGCGSDSNPERRAEGDDPTAPLEFGGEIASEVDRLLQMPRKPVTGEITATLNHIDLPLNPVPTREELEKLAAADNPPGYNAKFQLAKLNRGEELQTAIHYPIQTFRFGDSLTMVFLGGEICVDYSLRLQKELDADRVWLHGYSNDFGCYVPSERLVLEGGYGGGAEIVYFALPSTLQGGLEDKIVTEVKRQVAEEFHAAPEAQ